MGILSGHAIQQLVDQTKTNKRQERGPFLPTIDIEPFDPKNCGPNSYDVTLSDRIGCYVPGLTEGGGFVPDQPGGHGGILDMREKNLFVSQQIPDAGYILEPGRLYLGSTVEKTSCEGLVPWFDGRSSVGRLGLFVHVTAGRGDDGFGACESGMSTWTLEMVAVQPIRIYAGVRIGQISFMKLDGARKPYQGRYQLQEGPRPSELWRDFLKTEEQK